jgi:hypothetical protein
MAARIRELENQLRIQKQVKLADLTENVNKMAVENAERCRVQAEEAEAEVRSLRELVNECHVIAGNLEKEVLSLRNTVKLLEADFGGIFFAYNATEGDFKEFDTFEEAVDWIKKPNLDSDWGVSEEFQEGRCFIGKVTHRSKYTITDRKENYCQKVCKECPLADVSDCGHERWPHSDDWEYVGDLSFEPVSSDSSSRSEEAPPDGK